VFKLSALDIPLLARRLLFLLVFDVLALGAVVVSALYVLLFVFVFDLLGLDFLICLLFCRLAANALLLLVDDIVRRPFALPSVEPAALVLDVLTLFPDLDLLALFADLLAVVVVIERANLDER